MSVRTRFAPSPTGVLHIGSVRTALFCWLYARHHGGKFVLRIEDTDRERSTQENIEAILDGMSWLGLDADEGPFYQTERYNRYQEVSEQLLASGNAYYCYCSKERLDKLRQKQTAAGDKTRYDGRCRGREGSQEGVDPVVRFRNPLEGEVVINDQVKGRVVYRNEELDDLIILRSNGTPTYNFSVVVDDWDMEITHVIRGDDHLNNVPRQMNMLEALNVAPPAYAHLPMILGSDGAKLSKRHGAVDIREYRELGYLPEAMINYLVRLGWSYGDQEIFSIEEMIHLFDIANVNASASTFNPEKLRWLNQQYVIATSAAQLGQLLVPFLEKIGIDPADGPAPAEVADGFHERAETLVQMAESSRYCYQDFEEIDAKAAKKFLRPVVLEPLVDVVARFGALSDWTKEQLARAMHDCAEAHEISLGKLGQPIRVAITGGAVSPPIDVTLALVGRKKALQRLDRAIGLIKERAASG
jgi:glutamyl-tRNA synthetase